MKIAELNKWNCSLQETTCMYCIITIVLVTYKTLSYINTAFRWFFLSITIPRIKIASILLSISPSGRPKILHTVFYCSLQRWPYVAMPWTIKGITTVYLYLMLVATTSVNIHCWKLVGSKATINKKKKAFVMTELSVNMLNATTVIGNLVHVCKNIKTGFSRGRWWKLPWQRALGYAILVHSN